MSGTSDLPPGDPVAQVVVVCHANIARSPLAMVLLDAEARRRQGPDADVWVRSAGVRAVGGHPAADGSQRQAATRGLDLAPHRSVLLTRADLVEADLVLTMGEGQRGHAVRLHPPARQHTFTLVEFARLVRHVEPVGSDLPLRARIRTIVRRAAAARPYAERPEDPEDVADPFGGPDGGYETMATRVEGLVAVVAEALFGP